MLQEDITLSKVMAKQVAVKVLGCYPQEKDPPGCLSDLENVLDQLSQWCYPDGIKIYDENMHILNDTSPEFSFVSSALEELGERSQHPDEISHQDLIYSFVFTDNDKRRYCTCLTFHVRRYLMQEKMFIEDDVRSAEKPRYSKAVRRWLHSFRSAP